MTLSWDRITREVLEGKQRTRNRIREHADHEWEVIRTIDEIVLMDCNCGWTGWMPNGAIQP